MKKFLLILLCIPCFAVGPPWTYHITASTTNIPTAYPATAQLVGPHKITTMQCENLTGSEVEANCSSFSTTAPAVNSAQSIYIQSNDTFSTPDNSNLGDRCWFRSTSGAAITTAAIFQCTAWGN